MPKRGENIYKRKDGRWEGRIPKADGKFQYVYAKTYREVKEKKRICLEDINSVATKQSASHASAEELFELWLSGIKGRVKPSTYGNYYCCMQKYVIPFFNEAGNRQITVLSVKNFVKSIRDNKSIAETTKKKNLVIFKTAIKEVMKGVSDYSAILEAVKLPKTENASVQVFSINEQRLIENSVQRSDDIIAYGIILCFYTGIRLGELCALKWGDFDFEAGVMSIFRTVSRVKNFDQDEKKTMLLVGSPKSNRSARKIPLPEFMLKYSTELKSYCTDENCFVLSGTDTPIDPRTYQKLYKKLLKDAGVKYRKFHAIRHTFATRAMELGVDIKTISEILGHSNVSITLNIYTHSLMEQKKIAIDTITTPRELFTAPAPK